MSGTTRCNLLEINAKSGSDFVVTADKDTLKFRKKDPVSQQTEEILAVTGTGDVNVKNITISGVADFGNAVLAAVNAEYENLTVTTALNVGVGASITVAQTDPITNFTEWTNWTPAASYSVISNFAINQAKYSVFNKTVNACYDVSMQVGPYAHWKFDNAATDSGALGYNGTLLAGSSYSSSTFAIGTHSLLTSGATGGVTVDHAALKTVLGSDFTLSCWFNTINAATQNQVIIAGGGFTFDLRYNYNGDGTLKFFDRGNTTQFTGATWTPVANTWYHILLRRSGDLVSLSVGTIGTEWASFTALATNNNPGGTKQALTGVLRIGHKNGTSEFMNGYLDDFAIYDKVVDADFLSRLAGRRRDISAVNALFAARLLTRFVLPKLVASSVFKKLAMTWRRARHLEQRLMGLDPFFATISGGAQSKNSGHCLHLSMAILLETHWQKLCAETAFRCVESETRRRPRGGGGEDFILFWSRVKWTRF
eukprot:jgi/Mesvir1/19793/Mv13085-RA.1